MELFKNIWSPKKYVVVHANYEGSSLVLSSVIIDKSGEKIADETSFDSIEDLVKKHGKSCVYHLHIDGKGVLTRLVDRQSDYKRDLIINGDQDEFYFTSSSDSIARVVSFVRKSVANELVDYFQLNKLFLLSISCGFAPLTNLLEENDSLEQDYFVKRVNGGVVELQRVEQPKKRTAFKDVFFSKEALISKALFYPISNADFTFETEQFENIKTEHKEFTKFKTIGLLGIGAIFIVLLANYFYTNKLNNDIANKEAEIALSSSNLSILNQLSQEELRKQQLVLSSGAITSNFISFYLDEIGKDVPKDVRLKSMLVFPLKEKLKEKRKVEVDHLKIEIEGWTKSNIVLDDWIEVLDKQSWINSVELINYQKVTDTEAFFKIQLILAE